MQLEYLPVSALRSRSGNARTHSAKQVRKIAKSIEAFGFNNPILVDDKHVVIAGHGRLEAAKHLKMTTVPVMRLSHMSAEQVRAFVIADNRLALEAGWDKEILAIQLQGLVELDFDVQLTGFETAEIDILLGDAREAGETPATGEDSLPEPTGRPAVTRPGDLWILGRHRLCCADARDAASYDAVLQGEKADFIFTDPPFNVKIANNVSGLGKIRHEEFAMASGEMTRQQFTDLLTLIFRQMADNSHDGSIHEICIDWRHLREMLDAGHSVYSELKNVCIWNKTNGGMGSLFRSQHEMIFIWKNGNEPHVNNVELGKYGRSRSNVWTYSGANSFRPGRLDELAMHPTVKPVALVADAIKDCTRNGGLVLDPFCGSGTVLISAERTGRKARSLEVDCGYVDTAVRRWQNYAGKFAVLSETGETFERTEELRTTAANDNVKTNSSAA
jgi:DNA modification methylase